VGVGKEKAKSEKRKLPQYFKRSASLHPWRYPTRSIKKARRGRDYNISLEVGGERGETAGGGRYIWVGLKGRGRD